MRPLEWKQVSEGGSTMIAKPFGEMLQPREDDFEIYYGKYKEDVRQLAYCWEVWCGNHLMIRTPAATREVAKSGAEQWWREAVCHLIGGHEWQHAIDKGIKVKRCTNCRLQEVTS